MLPVFGEEWDELPEPGDGNNKKDEKNEGVLEPGKGNNDKNEKSPTKIKNNKDKTVKNVGLDDVVSWPCGVCNKGVGRTGCECIGCGKWVHSKCSGLKSLNHYKRPTYRCSKCKGIEKERKRGRPRKASLPQKDENETKIGKLAKSKRPREPKSPRKTNSKKDMDQERSPSHKKSRARKSQEEEAEENEEEEEDEVEDEDEEEEAVAEKIENKKENGQEGSLKGLGKGVKDGNTKNQSEEEEKILTYSGGHLTKGDYKSLNERNWVRDSIIHLFITLLTEKVGTCLRKNKITIVEPAIVQFLKTESDKEVISNQIKELKLKESDWVMYPVNNNDDPDDGNGGTHWSLLVYRKKDNKYLHFDPIPMMNRNHGVKLMLSLLDCESIGRDGYGPQILEMRCKKQENGYDCGPYVMMYLETIIDNIGSGREVDDDRFIPHDFEEIRKLLRDGIEKEISETWKKEFKKTYAKEEMEEKKYNHSEKERKNNKDKGSNNERNEGRNSPRILDNLINNWEKVNTKAKKRESIKDGCKDGRVIDKGYNNGESNNGRIYRDYRNTDITNREGENIRKQRKPCRNFIQSVCRFGNYCRYDHPEICNSWEEIGRCNGVSGSCEKPHPQICRSYTENEICHRKNCRFMHPRQRKRINEREQQRASLRVQDHKFQRDRSNFNRSHGVQYRRHFFQHQGRGPYIRDQSYQAREDIGIQRAVVKRMVREVMEDNMRRGWYTEGY